MNHITLSQSLNSVPAFCPSKFPFSPKSTSSVHLLQAKMYSTLSSTTVRPREAWRLHQDPPKIEEACDEIRTAFIDTLPTKPRYDKVAVLLFHWDIDDTRVAPLEEEKSLGASSVICSTSRWNTIKSQHILKGLIPQRTYRIDSIIFRKHTKVHRIFSYLYTRVTHGQTQVVIDVNSREYSSSSI